MSCDALRRVGASLPSAGSSLAPQSRSARLGRARRFFDIEAIGEEAQRGLVHPRLNAGRRPHLPITNDGPVESRFLGPAAVVDPCSDAARWRLVLDAATDLLVVKALQNGFQSRRRERNGHRPSVPPFCSSAWRSRRNSSITLLTLNRSRRLPFALTTLPPAGVTGRSFRGASSRSIQARGQRRAFPPSSDHVSLDGRLHFSGRRPSFYLRPL